MFDAVVRGRRTSEIQVRGLLQPELEASRAAQPQDQADSAVGFQISMPRKSDARRIFGPATVVVKDSECRVVVQGQAPLIGLGRPATAPQSLASFLYFPADCARGGKLVEESFRKPQPWYVAVASEVREAVPVTIVGEMLGREGDVVGSAAVDASETAEPQRDGDVLRPTRKVVGGRGECPRHAPRLVVRHVRGASDLGKHDGLEISREVIFLDSQARNIGEGQRG